MDLINPPTSYGGNVIRQSGWNCGHSLLITELLKELAFSKKQKNKQTNKQTNKKATTKNPELLSTDKEIKTRTSVDFMSSLDTELREW